MTRTMKKSPLNPPFFYLLICSVAFYPPLALFLSLYMYISLQRLSVEICDDEDDEEISFKPLVVKPDPPLVDLSSEDSTSSLSSTSSTSTTIDLKPAIVSV